MVHQLLPRTLARMSQSTTEPSSDLNMEEILQQVNVFAEDPDFEDLAKGKDWEELLQGLAEGSHAEVTPAELNRKRKKLAFAAIADPSFGPQTVLIDYLNLPLTLAMQKLMQRTADIAELHQLCAQNAGHDILESRMKRHVKRRLR